MGVHSTRAKIIDRRTYIRPLDEKGETFETKAQAIQRVIDHQNYLWTQAKEAQFKYLKDEADELLTQAQMTWEGAAIAALEDAATGKTVEFIQKTSLTNAEIAELEDLRTLFATRMTSLSGRVKWMAGTEVIRERPSAAFNCSFSNIKLPADVVDAFWLLLQGCGVGFRPIPGMLTGFPQTLKIEYVPSTRTERGGREKTISTIKDGVWTIVFGDSAKGWAKGIGKMLAKKPGNVHTLRLDYSQLRPGGLRLRGYGWISSGWEPLMRGLQIIVNVLNARVGETLNSIDIGDIINALGTVLSSRRSAQIWLCDSDSPDLDAFITAKDNYFERGFYWRAQSNNSIAFKSKPTREFLRKTFDSIMTSGEPGLYNLEAARRRAPWAEGTNPCAEIILPDKGFCNLVQIVFHRYNGRYEALKRDVALMARANYRQTLVSMRDGVLQVAWDDNNKLLRLCGVSPLGWVGWEFANDAEKTREIAQIAIDAANGMADELGEARPALVTQVQPGGTSSKVLGEDGDEVFEGVHLPLGRFIFNNVGFSKHDPIVQKCLDAGYHVQVNPYDAEGVLIRLPVEYPEGPWFTKFDRLKTERGYFEQDGRYFLQIDDGIDMEVSREQAHETLEINVESAVAQLDRYKFLMDHYVDHNCSVTISYDDSEADAIVDWLLDNWDSYIGVSFIKRNDPTKTAADLGHAYLPQEVVTEETFRDYVSRLGDVSIEDDTSLDLVNDPSCATGACPVR